LQPDGTGKALVIWSGGTKRFKNVKGIAEFVSTQIGDFQFRIVHTGRISY
jgi:hypothetical protein